MADTPTQGETVTQEPLKNDASTTSNPTQQGATTQEPTKDNASDTAAEELRKKLEQAEMERNQLRNKLNAEEKAKEEAKKKELEEQEQYKSLYEQERAKREEFEKSQEEAKRKQEIDEAKEKVFSDYSDEVRILANETGMDLTDADEASVEQFKQKLDRIKEMMPGAKVSGNNPNPVEQKQSLSRDDIRGIMRDEKQFSDYVLDKFPGIAAMTNKQK